MSISSDRSLYTAVAYADIFDYPLTLTECRLFSQSRVLAKPQKLMGVTLKKSRGVTYYFLSGRERILPIRDARQTYATYKWQRARIIASALGRIPTVLLVAVTGALAMNNAHEDDDIDLYIVTENNTLWITRFLVTAFITLLGVRRTPHTKNVKDLFCLNMFTTIDGMGIPIGERDLFTAHEVVQMIPLWERRGTYKKFLERNRWTKGYLPYAWKRITMKKQSTLSSVSKKRNMLYLYTLKIVEPFAQGIQRMLMRRKITTEIVSNTILRFHPHDARVWIKKKLQLRLKKQDISIDSVFVHPLE